ncbi:MAG: AAA family ATPase [Candidatus Ranarchaeia archaeon]
MDKLFRDLEEFDKKILHHWGFKSENIELFGINDPSLYVVPEPEETAIKKAVDLVRDATASVVVSGPLGAGKTTFMEIIERSLKQIPEIRVIKIEGVSSSDALLDDIIYADYKDNKSFAEYWKEKTNITVLKHGSTSKRLSRLLLAMRKTAEKENLRYVLMIDEFRQLERAREETRTRIIDMLLKMVNEKTNDGRRYLVLVLAVITRVGESAYKTIEVISTVGEKLGHGTKSAIRRRFVEVYDIQTLDEKSAFKIMTYRIAHLKGNDEVIKKRPDPTKLDKKELDLVVHPFTQSGLKAIYTLSGGNPGIMLELLLRLIHDARRGTDSLYKDGYRINDILSAYKIDEQYVLKYASKEMRKAKAELNRFQNQLLDFLSTSRTVDEIGDWLMTQGKKWENVLEDFDLFEKRGLIYSPERGKIQATELWTRGSQYL